MKMIATFTFLLVLSSIFSTCISSEYPDELPSSLLFPYQRDDHGMLSEYSRKHHRQLAMQDLEGVTTTLVLKPTDASGNTCVNTTVEIANSLFFNQDLSYKSQMEACSNNKKIIEPASDDPKIMSGVLSYQSNINITHDLWGTVVPSVLNETMAELNINNLTSFWERYDNVMICLPRSDLGWDFGGGATIPGKVSAYVNDVITDTRTVMHEVGHLMGLAHAAQLNPNGTYLEYGDGSGHMGGDFYRRGAAYCYNGAHSLNLGWYSDRTGLFDSQILSNMTYQLVGVCHYNLTETNIHTVLIQIPRQNSQEDIVVAYNRADGLNSGVPEFRDTVTITRRGNIHEESLHLGSICLPGDAYSFRITDFDGTNTTLVVKVNQFVYGSPDYAEVNVYIEEEPKQDPPTYYGIEEELRTDHVPPDNSFAGVFFDVVANNHLEVTNLDIHFAGLNSTCNVQVWTKPCTWDGYHKYENSASWIKVFDETLFCPKWEHHKLSSANNFTHIHIYEGNTQGFYVITDPPNIRLTLGGEVHEQHSENTDIMILNGKASNDPELWSSPAYYSSFSGALYYRNIYETQDFEDVFDYAQSSNMTYNLVEDSNATDDTVMDLRVLQHNGDSYLHIFYDQNLGIVTISEGPGNNRLQTFCQEGDYYVVTDYDGINGTNLIITATKFVSGVPDYVEINVLFSTGPVPSSPVYDFDSEQELDTPYSGNTVVDGNFFDIVAQRDLQVTSMKFRFYTVNANCNIQVWTKPCSYENSVGIANADMWTKVFDETIFCPSWQYHKLNTTKFSPVTIKENNTQAFYIFISPQNLFYERMSNREEEEFYVRASNADIQVLNGREGVNFEFFETNPYSQYAVGNAGTNIYYQNVIDVTYPTPTPTSVVATPAAPTTPGGSLATAAEIVFTLELSSESRRRLESSSKKRRLASCTSDLLNVTVIEIIEGIVENILTAVLDQPVNVTDSSQSLDSDGCSISLVVDVMLPNDSNNSTLSTILEALENEQFSNSILQELTINYGLANINNVHFDGISSIINPLSDVFSWDVFYKGSQVMFNDQSSNEEVTIEYNVSLRDRAVALYDYESCSEPVDETIIGARYLLIPATETHGTLTVALNIEQSMVVGSSVWTDGPSSNLTKFILFCVRVDLNERNVNTATSVAFQETKFNLTIDMSKNFSITGVNTNRDGAVTTNVNATLNYAITGTQCTAEGEDITSPPELSQGDICGLCVKTNGTGIQVADILSLNLKQTKSSGPDFVYQAIVNGETRGLTTIDCATINPGICVTRTQLVSEFFSEDQPTAIEAYGTCVLKMGSARRLLLLSNNNRLLQRQGVTTDSYIEKLEDDIIEDSFSIQVGLSSNNMFATDIQEVGSGALPSFAGVVASIVVLFFVASTVSFV